MNEGYGLRIVRPRENQGPYINEERLTIQQIDEETSKYKTQEDYLRYRGQKNSEIVIDETHLEIVYYPEAQKGSIKAPESTELIMYKEDKSNFDEQIIKSKFDKYSMNPDFIIEFFKKYVNKNEEIVGMFRKDKSKSNLERFIEMVREIKAMLREPLEFNYINYRRMYFYIKYYEEKFQNQLFNKKIDSTINEGGKVMQTDTILGITQKKEMEFAFMRLYKHIKPDVPWLNDKLSNITTYETIGASWAMFIEQVLVDKLKELFPTGDLKLDEIIQSGNIRKLSEDQVSKLNALLSIEKDYVR
jgi:hypothetical protein